MNKKNGCRDYFPAVLESSAIYVYIELMHFVNLIRIFIMSATLTTYTYREVHVGNDQEKAQSEKDSHFKNRGGKKTKSTIRYLHHENIS